MVQMRIKVVENRTSELTEQLVEVWEASVRATHHFLDEQEIAAIKPYVPSALSEVTHLVIAENMQGKPVAFMGVDGDTLEMLFIAPDERGKGLGRRLLQHGIDTYSLCKVTVNEQNPQAIGFYQRMGFTVYKRTECDEQGRPYPLLYMQTSNQT